MLVQDVTSSTCSSILATMRMVSSSLMLPFGSVQVACHDNSTIYKHYRIYSAEFSPKY